MVRRARLTSRAMTSTTSSAVQDRPTRIARASRVYSSTMLQSLILRRSDVSSNWKSTAHTSFALVALRRCFGPPGSRRRLRLLTGRIRPSWRQTRRVRLRFRAQPSLSRISCAVFQPHRGCSPAISRNRRASLSSAGRGTGGCLRCVERCWPTRRHARRSETPKRACNR